VQEENYNAAYQNHLKQTSNKQHIMKDLMKQITIEQNHKSTKKTPKQPAKSKRPDQE